MPIAAAGASQVFKEADSKAVRLRFIYRQKLIKDFLRRWEVEYLSSLRAYSKSSGGANACKPREGDVVLVHDDSPRLNWRLGRVEKLFLGDDGLCRSALVRLGRTQNLVKRAITSLYPLEMRESVSEGECVRAPELVSGASLSKLPLDDQATVEGVSAERGEENGSAAKCDVRLQDLPSIDRATRKRDLKSDICERVVNEEEHDDVDRAWKRAVERDQAVESRPSRAAARDGEFMRRFLHHQ